MIYNYFSNECIRYTGFWSNLNFHQNTQTIGHDLMSHLSISINEDALYKETFNKFRIKSKTFAQILLNSDNTCMHSIPRYKH